MGFLLLGFVVGGVMGLVVPGRPRHFSIGMTFVLGLVGSVVGGVVANALGSGPLFKLNLIGSLAAISAAVALIVIGERLGWLARHTRKEQ